MRAERTSGQSGLRESEKRATDRVAVSLGASLVWDGVAIRALVTDLGMGGLFAETATQGRLDSTAIVTLELPAGALRLLGTVRWAKPHGIGVQFDPLGARETHCLAALITATRDELGGVRR